MKFQARQHLAPTLAAFSMLLAVPASAQGFNFNLDPCAFTTVQRCKSATPPARCSQSGFESACRSLLQPELQQSLDAFRLSGEASLGYGASSASNGGLMPDVTRAADIGALRAHSQPAPAISTLHTFSEGLMEYSNRVHSCEEYAYQLGHDYSQYKIIARHFGADYKGLYNHAYQWGRREEGGIGARGLYRRSSVNRTMTGQVLPEMQIPLQDAEFPYRAKNDFFYIKGGSAFTEFESRHPAIAAKIDAGQQHYTINNIWRFHRDMGSALRHEPAAKLEHLRAKRKEFLGLLAEHRRVSNDTNLNAFGRRWQLSGINNSIERALLDADAAGCLDSSNQTPHACDWSHRDFHEEISTKLENRRQLAQKKCVTNTGDRFYNLPPNYRVQNNRLITISTPATGSAKAMRDFLIARSDVDRWAANRVTRVDSPRQLPKWGEQYGDSWSKGNSVASATLGYNVEWGIDLDTSATDACETRIHGEASLEGEIQLFGSTKEVLDARASFDSATNMTHAHLSIFGNETYDENMTAKGEIFNITIKPKTWKKEGTLVSAEKTVLIFGIPITVAAGASGKIGFERALELNAEGELACVAVNATASAKPYAGIKGFADASVGVTGLKAGAGADLTILDASMPVDLSLRAEAGTEITIKAAADAKLIVTTLAGSIYAFLEHPTISWSGLDITRTQENLFSWDGFSWNIQLLDREYSYGLSILKLICEQSNYNCGS